MLRKCMFHLRLHNTGLLDLLKFAKKYLIILRKYDLILALLLSILLMRYFQPLQNFVWILSKANQWKSMFVVMCFGNTRLVKIKPNTYSIYQTSMKNTKQPNKLCIEMSFFPYISWAHCKLAVSYLTNAIMS